MANQKRAAGADLWFVTAEGAGKLRDIEADPHVNLSYYKDRTREWISVSVLSTIRATPRASVGPSGVRQALRRRAGRRHGRA